jgi:predicted transport protein
VEVWNEAAIQGRADRLAAKAVEVWAMPVLSDEAKAALRPKTSDKVGYGLESHPHLLSPVVGPVFEALRKEVLALDDCVSEEFLKLYVAYKAETNFVDVIPQAKRLLLMLNMPFGELSDPRGMARDVSGMGKWGNGDVEVPLTTVDELPYVMGLIRQSFERQMAAVSA